MNDPKRHLKTVVTNLEHFQTRLEAMVQDSKKLVEKANDALFDNLPQTPEDMEALLMELVDAADDCKEHFNRFKNPSDLPWEQQSVECRDDWSRALSRKEEAVLALIRFGRLVREKKETKET